MSLSAWRQVVDELNDREGTDYHLAERLPGGLQGGAWVVIDHTAAQPARRVLTWTADAGLVARRAETARLVAALRERGYPTPAWRHWGVLESDVAYVIADLAPGEPGPWATTPVDQVAAAVELQAGAAGPSASTWSHYLRWALTSEDGPRSDLSSHGRTATELLRLVDRAVARIDGVVLPTEDAVHGDLGIGNILLDRASAEPRITIIDIDACGPGTRAIDYAWLHRDAVSHTAPSAAEQFETAGRAVAGDDVWRACVSLACLELAAFVARNGTPSQTAAELGRMVSIVGSCAGA